eukprot:TRINITY_DN2838_c0_g8_i1.p1 TRINITY_DN2838_c0_g8~~TRINITY_DN2838_c0_g8_i1.p1  ORF type:complete len:442 (+),score=37.68 TRINITY_DN2838_c0_g8_i1:55-1380(+)
MVPPIIPEGTDPQSLTAWVLDLGTHFALEYSLQTGMNFVQTACAVIGVSGVTLATRKALATPAKIRCHEPLYRRLHGECGEHMRMHHHFKFRLNPYSYLTRHNAVILQGRTQEGKTTLLRTAIPGIHRWHIFGMKWLCWQGIYFNGAEACRNRTFDAWVTSQMFGLVPQAGSELKQCLWDWRQCQWFRLYMEIIWMPVLLPRPLYIIVDQFEELLKTFPEQAVPWADAVTNYQTRNNLARVIFVVNSDAAAETLLNLDWRHSRFTRLVMDPLSADDVKGTPYMDTDLFEECRNNIGLYLIARKALFHNRIRREDVPTFVQSQFTRWELEFQVPFPQFLHNSWLGLTLPEAKRALVRGMQALLRESAVQNEENDDEGIRETMAVFKPAVMRLDARQFYYTSQSDWREVLANKWLAKPGLSGMDANVVAKHVKRLMANPVGWR